VEKALADTILLDAASSVRSQGEKSPDVKSLAKSCCNLARLCGNVGIRGGGVNPLKGQNNEKKS
jgi:predicted molibdopterin-dependent oxidoreductase YjgC